MPPILQNILVDGLDGTYQLAMIHIENGFIAHIESSEIQAHEIGLAKFYVTCGFVNSHIHPNQLSDRRMLDGLPISELLSTMHTQHKKTDEDRYAQALCVLIDALKSGATSLYAIASNPMPAIRAFKNLDLTGAISCVFNDVWEGAGNTPSQISFADVENEFAEFYAHNSSDLRIHIGSASILTASNELLLLFDDIAKRYNTRVNIHMSEGSDCVEKCLQNRGFTPVRLLAHLGVLNERWNLIHATTVDDVEVRLISAAGATVTHCPVSNAKTGVGIAPMRAFHEAGVTIGLGTDACSNNNTNNILNEAYFSILLQSALHKDPALFTIDTVFEWMTTNGHKIVGSGQHGKLEVGARADLLLWDLSVPAFTPLAYGRLKSVLINNAPDVKPHTVLINGNAVIENYTFVGSAEAAALQAVNAWARESCG
ncbi:MAG: amidohydrolase family protein [Pseudomonadota bacterium]